MRLLTQPQYRVIRSAMSGEDTGWIISLGLTDPSCRAKNTSHYNSLKPRRVSLGFSPALWRQTGCPVTVNNTQRRRRHLGLAVVSLLNMQCFCFRLIIQVIGKSSLWSWDVDQRHWRLSNTLGTSERPCHPIIVYVLCCNSRRGGIKEQRGHGCDRESLMVFIRMIIM